jgi:hypothetical protein
MSSLEQDVQNEVDESDPEHPVDLSLVGFVADEFILIQYSPFLKDEVDARAVPESKQSRVSFSLT